MILKHVLHVKNKNYILNLINVLLLNQDWNHIANNVNQIILMKSLDNNFILHEIEHKKNKYNNYLSLMGCDSRFFKLWFKFQFDEIMNWENHGTYFHFDHVKPCSLFNIEDDNDRRLMNHLSNLSPLEKYEYIKKSKKYNDEIKLNHTTKILWFLDHLNKTDPDLYKFATESYSNLS